MRKRGIVYIITGLVALSIVVVLFVPLVGVEATPPNFQPYSTITTVEGNQTRTFTLVATPPTYNSMASISYCFWGYGALLQNGNYYPITTSHLQVVGAFCPTPQP